MIKMCVIMVCGKTKPTEEMIEDAFSANPQGAGIAWREPSGKNNAVEVHWEKGIRDVKDIKGLINDLPLPFISHFRISSCGDAGVSELTHPFPIDYEVPLFLRGKTGGYVLFHNGSWSLWRDKAQEVALKAEAGKKMPIGKWSDTRAMAYCAAHFGVGFLELVNEKVVIFGPKHEYIFHEDGWAKINDVWCSNNHFVQARNFRRTSGTAAADNYDYEADSCAYGGDWKPTVCLQQGCHKLKATNSAYCLEHDSFEKREAATRFHRGARLPEDKCAMSSCNGMTVTTLSPDERKREMKLWCEVHARGKGHTIVKDELGRPYNPKGEANHSNSGSQKADLGGGGAESEFRHGRAAEGAGSEGGRQQEVHQQESLPEGQGRLSEMVSQNQGRTNEGSLARRGLDSALDLDSMSAALTAEERGEVMVASVLMQRRAEMFRFAASPSIESYRRPRKQVGFHQVGADVRVAGSEGGSHGTPTRNVSILASADTIEESRRLARLADARQGITHIGPL